MSDDKSLRIVATAALILPNFLDRLAKALLKKKTIDPIRGCWLWPGSRKNYGYGIMSLWGRQWRVHRLAAALWIEGYSEAIDVLHTCDVPNCFNPDHLYYGTQRDNANDMVARQRTAHPRGERHPLAKLTDDNVREIRRLCLDLGRKQRDVAKAFNVTQPAIGRICRGEGWSHVQ